MAMTLRIMRCAFVFVTMCAAASPILATSAHAQYRYYGDSYPRSYYYAPQSYGYYRPAPYSGSYGGYDAPSYRSYGNIHGGGAGYYGDPGYSSMDSNGQRRTGSDAGSFGGMGR